MRGYGDEVRALDRASGPRPPIPNHRHLRVHRLHLSVGGAEGFQPGLGLGGLRVRGGLRPLVAAGSGLLR